MLFDDKREVELVWNGKTNEVCNIVLPFQTIEQVDEPRAETDTQNDARPSRARSKRQTPSARSKRPTPTAAQPLLFDLDNRGRQLRGWTTKLIWKYERQHYIGVYPFSRHSREGGNPEDAIQTEELDSRLRGNDVRRDMQQRIIEQKEADFLDLILRAYRAEKTDGFTAFHGKKAGRLVSVGPVNLPITRLFVEEIILECRKKHITKVDMLGFEFEMGLFPNVLDEARSKGIDIAPKYIPAEVFDKRAVEKNQVVFHDVSFIEVKPHVRAAYFVRGSESPAVAVELTDFSVFYSQDSIAHAEEALKKKGSKIVVEKGGNVKVSKDAKRVFRREVRTER